MSDATKFGDGKSVADLDSVRQACASVAVRCAGEPLLGRGAALCLAATTDLSDGLDPWTAFFLFDPEHDAAIWRVCNIEEAAVGGAAGRCVVVDAVDGVVLDREEWFVGA